MLRPRTVQNLEDAMANGPLIARGGGRAYGNCARNQNSTIDMACFNRMLDFGSQNGIPTTEAGIGLR